MRLVIRVEVALATLTIAANQRPSYLRLSRAGEPCLHTTEPADIERPTVLQHGAGAVVLASGPIVAACLDAAHLLKRDGYDVTAVSVACLKPLDEDFLLDLVSKFRFLLTVEEHIRRGGLYS
jgi:transketolase